MAERALLTTEEPDGFKRVADDGACGLLSHGAVDVVTMPESNNGGVPTYRVVVFRSAGATSVNLWSGSAGYVYSPSHDPKRCRDALGPDNFTACSVDDLGGDWFRVDAAIASN